MKTDEPVNYKPTIFFNNQIFNVMRINKMKLSALIAGLAMIIFSSTDLSAQRPGRGLRGGYGPGGGQEMQRPVRGYWAEDIPGLSDEQKTSIEELRTAHFRKAELMRAEIGEKQARLRTLRLAEKQDEKAIDKAIDEISKLRGDIMKEREAHRRGIKALLNDEQKTWYDNNCGRGYGRGRNDDNIKPGRRGPGMRSERYCPYYD